MNNPSYNPPAPSSGNGKKTALIIIGVVLIFCCLCTAVAGAGAAAYILLQRSAPQEYNLVPTQIEETFPVFEATPTVKATPVPEDTPVPKATPFPIQLPTATLAASSQSQPGGPGLGVSRAEMIDFYTSGGAFEFDDPTEIQGLEVIMGTHTWLCVKTNCAAVTLGGPEDDLVVVAVVVPSKPGDDAQNTLGILLLMTTAARFTDAEAVEVVPSEIMQDLFAAQAAGKSFEKTIESSGYIFTESYDAATHNAGLGISRPRD